MRPVPTPSSFETAKERLDEGVIVAVAKFSKYIASTAGGEPFFQYFPWTTNRKADVIRTEGHSMKTGLASLHK